jgi:hypothetical protein
VFCCSLSEEVWWRGGEGCILVFCSLFFEALPDDGRSLLKAYIAVGARRPAAIQVRLSARSCAADFEVSHPLEESMVAGRIVGRQTGKHK